MDEKLIQLESQILERVIGKVSLFQSPETRKNIVADAFGAFCKDLSALGEQNSFVCQEGAARKDLLNQILSYGMLDKLLDDPEVEDIIINGLEPVCVHRSRKGLQELEDRFETMDELDLLIKKILVFAGKSELKKINNIELPNMRGRVNIVYSPMGPELTITKIKTNPLSIVDLIRNKTMNAEMAAMLWLYVEGLGVKPANLLIVGGPGSGKTTLLNALLSFIPEQDHMVIIEDTMELLTHWIKNTSRLESDEDMSLADLVKNSLRMRPERIVVGEVRGQEAEDMVTAMNIGKYCMATIHAGRTRDAILRLQSHPMNIPETLITLIDVFVVMSKHKTGEDLSRVVSEISETSNLEQKTVLIAPLWKFDTANTQFERLSPSTVYRDRLSQMSGYKNIEIINEVDQRRKFLEMLVKRKVSSVQDVAKSCTSYLKARQTLSKADVPRK